MTLEHLLDELARVAARVGLEVRLEAFEAGLREARVPRGGLCTVRGRRVVLVDSAAPLPDQVAMLATALAEVETEQVFMPPIARATIQLYRRQSREATPPVRAPQPLARARGQERGARERRR